MELQGKSAASQSIRHLRRTYGVNISMSTCRKPAIRSTTSTRKKSATWKDLWAVAAQCRLDTQPHPLLHKEPCNNPQAPSRVPRHAHL